MPDFDAAVARTIEAQRKVTDAAKAASDEINAQRGPDLSAQPVVLLAQSTPTEQPS